MPPKKVADWQLAKIKDYQNDCCLIELCVKNTGQQTGLTQDWLVVGCFLTTDQIFQDLLDKGTIKRTIKIEDQT